MSLRSLNHELKGGCGLSSISYCNYISYFMGEMGGALESGWRGYQDGGKQLKKLT